MDNFINRIFSKEPSSADKAKDRLRLVLINDRTDLSAAAMENLKDDLLEVLSRYIHIDPKSMRIDITQEGRQQRLIADIPISGPVSRKY
ncbi:MAG: cell division topological specificity factor MinE [Chloroflexota bacterium]|nr:cell division topological specificity factor MinE [Anaerolineales bacterium]RLD05344.1 MAG: cell division topological specificity factor MinE [Chloroflexota bacterium]HDD62630.1 cell division topological specificity factor MinE [Chloroflexota bacterium]